MKNGELVHRSTYLLQKKCTYCLTQPNASKSGLFMCSSDIDTAKNISFPNSFQVKPKLHMANMWNHTKCNISTLPASPCLCSRGKWTVSDSLCFHKTLPINALSSSMPAGERDVTISLPNPASSVWRWSSANVLRWSSNWLKTPFIELNQEKAKERTALKESQSHPNLHLNLLHDNKLNISLCGGNTPHINTQASH